MDLNALDPVVDEIRGLLAERLRVRGKTFEAQLRKARRLLPRAVRREATFLEQSSKLIGNPKLARMVDMDHVARARRVVVDHLRQIDPSRRRRDALLNWAAFVGLVVLVAGGGVIWALWVRGLV